MHKRSAVWNLSSENFINSTLYWKGKKRPIMSHKKRLPLTISKPWLSPNWLTRSQSQPNWSRQKVSVDAIGLAKSFGVKFRPPASLQRPFGDCSLFFEFQPFLMSKACKKTIRNNCNGESYLSLHFYLSRSILGTGGGWIAQQPPNVWSWTVWPDLAKFHHFGKIFKVLGNF